MYNKNIKNISVLSLHKKILIIKYLRFQKKKTILESPFYKYTKFQVSKFEKINNLFNLRLYFICVCTPKLKQS